MIFTETKLKGAFVIDIETIGDERGFFARGWCRKEFDSHHLVSSMLQANISFNKKKGTLRGMHFQVAPKQEAKLVRCTTGAIYDVIIDLRSDSDTYKEWTAVELTAENHKMFYVPEGFAHGYQTLQDNTEVFYLVSEFYSPEHERGIRWNDPTFNIKWPILHNIIISDKDRNQADYIP